MSIITLAEAKAQVRETRIDTNQDALIEGYIEAAEASAADYIDANLYASPEDLATAIAAAPDALDAAYAAYVADIAAANAIPADAVPYPYGERRRVYDDRRCESAQSLRELAIAQAEAKYSAAQSNVLKTYRGVVMDGAIKSACLLLIANLMDNRGAVVDSRAAVELPLGVRHLLDLKRAGLGV